MQNISIKRMITDNVLYYEIVKKSKTYSGENASVATELSTAAPEIGHRAKSQSRLVSETANIGENSFKEAIDRAQTIDRHLDEVEDALKKTDETTGNTTSQSLRMKEKMANVIDKMREIREISTANARSVEEIAGAAEHLSHLTEELRILIDAFKS